MESSREKLNEKVEKEYENFIAETKLKPVEQIMSSSYEQVFKDDLRTIILNANLEPQEVKVLLKLYNVLQTAYDGWMDKEESYMDRLGDSFRDTLEEVVNNYILVCF